MPSEGLSKNYKWKTSVWKLKDLVVQQACQARLETRKCLIKFYVCSVLVCGCVLTTGGSGGQKRGNFEAVEMWFRKRLTKTRLVEKTGNKEVVSSGINEKRALLNATARLWGCLLYTSHRV